MTAHQLAELARLSDRAKACAGWHETWADASRTVLKTGFSWRIHDARRHARRARVAFASARKAWVRVAEYARECAL